MMTGNPQSIPEFPVLVIGHGLFRARIGYGDGFEEMVVINRGRVGHGDRTALGNAEGQVVQVGERQAFAVAVAIFDAPIGQ